MFDVKKAFDRDVFRSPRNIYDEASSFNYFRWKAPLQMFVRVSNTTRPWYDSWKVLISNLVPRAIFKKILFFAFLLYRKDTLETRLSYFRSSHWRCSVKKACSFIKNRLQHRLWILWILQILRILQILWIFLVNIVKNFKNTFLESGNGCFYLSSSKFEPYRFWALC